MWRCRYVGKETLKEVAIVEKVSVHGETMRLSCVGSMLACDRTLQSKGANPFETHKKMRSMLVCDWALQTALRIWGIQTRGSSGV